MPRAANNQNSMEALIAQYRELKAKIEDLEAQKREIADKFKAGLTAFGVDVARVPVNSVIYQLKIVNRATHSCQWEAFKANHPELYEEYVNDGTAQYVDVRPVNE
jgi:hypothetical protein